MKDKLTDDNYILLAMRIYSNPNCHSMEAFKYDLNGIKYIKRLLNKYNISGKVNVRLLVNRVIIFSNNFGGAEAAKFLFYKIDKSCHSTLKTILMFLNIMPDVILGVGDVIVKNKDIPIDKKMEEYLNEM